MFSAANMAFMMYQGLTHGRLFRDPRAWHGRAEGDLSAEDGLLRVDRHHEPDRAALRHRSRPDAHQGRAAGRRQLRITGQKIFISAGEHDMAENIIHLVLAKIPGAPEGVKGISLFIVPEVPAVNEDGSPGARNGVPAARSKRRWASTATPPA
jgi:hypothetical protein